MLPFLTQKKLLKVEIFRLNLKNSSDIKKHPQNTNKSAKICMGFYLLCPRDLVTRKGEREMRSASASRVLPNNLGELAYMYYKC